MEGLLEGSFSDLFDELHALLFAYSASDVFEDVFLHRSVPRQHFGLRLTTIAQTGSASEARGQRRFGRHQYSKVQRYDTQNLESIFGRIRRHVVAVPHTSSEQNRCCGRLGRARPAIFQALPQTQSGAHHRQPAPIRLSAHDRTETRKQPGLSPMDRHHHGAGGQAAEPGYVRSYTRRVTCFHRESSGRCNIECKGMRIGSESRRSGDSRTTFLAKLLQQKYSTTVRLRQQILVGGHTTLVRIKQQSVRPDEGNFW